MIESIIYVSKKSELYKDEDLKKIVESAQKHNAENSVTGALAVVDNWFMQYLEGSAPDVNRTYRRISEDKRHHLLMIRHYGFADARLFDEWSMEDVTGEMRTWLDKTKDEHGRLDLYEITPADALAFFKALSERD